MYLPLLSSAINWVTGGLKRYPALCELFQQICPERQVHEKGWNALGEGPLHPEIDKGESTGKPPKTQVDMVVAEEAGSFPVHTPHSFVSRLAPRGDDPNQLKASQDYVLHWKGCRQQRPSRPPLVACSSKTAPRLQVSL